MSHGSPFVGHGGLWAISGCIIFSNIVVTDYTSDCFIKEYQSITVRQEILTAIKLDEFDELFVSSIFNSSNFY